MSWTDLTIQASRFLFLMTLIIAPWAYGSTRPWTILLLQYCMSLTLGVWVLSLTIRRMLPRVPWWIITMSLVLLAQGWWMAANAKSLYDTEYYQFIPLPQKLAGAPGSVDSPLSMATMTRLTLLLLMSWMACDISRRDLWRKRICLTVALTGLSIVVLGLLQRLTEADGIFWQPDPRGNLFFGPYFYHANAGAFINLTWPMVAMYLVHALARPERIVQKNFWIIATVIMAAGALVNTSRAAGGIAVLMALGFLARAIWNHRTELASDWKAQLSSTVVVLLVVGIVAIAAGAVLTYTRWSSLGDQLNDRNGRLVAAKVCLKMLPHAGWLGFGPGTFQVVFPFFTHGAGPDFKGFWRYAHQDYLQTMVEWGKWGMAVWTLYFAGAFWPAREWIYAFKAKRQKTSEMRKLHEGREVIRFKGLETLDEDTGSKMSKAALKNFRFAWRLGLGGVLLHSMVDFPLQIASIQLYAAVYLGMLYQGLRKGP